MYQLDETDRKLLTILQAGIPLCSRPYEEIARRISRSTASGGTQIGSTGQDAPAEEAVMDRIRRLKEEKIIRRMTGLFDSGRLGYTSVLCGMKIAEPDIDRMSDLLLQYPGITHNYLRDHEYNMWFTLISPNARHMDQVIRQIEKSGLAGRILRLYPEKKYKIRANFSVETSGASTQTDAEHDPEHPGAKDSPASGPAPENYAPTDADIRLIRLLQEEFPVCSRPFLELGRKLAVSEDEPAVSEDDVIAMTQRLREHGCLKRLAAVLYHTTVGYRVNAMIVWDVPDDRIEEAAARAIQLPRVSHCYKRNRDAAFDYNFYTMIHATSEEDLESLIDQLQPLIQPVKYCSLRTKRELKKTGMKYFMEF